MTINFDTRNISILDGSYTHSFNWTNLLLENSGYFSELENYVILECDGKEVCVDFELEVYGKPKVYRGDQYEPDFISENIEDVIISLKEVQIDGEYVLITPDFKKVFTKIIEEVI